MKNLIYITPLLILFSCGGKQTETTGKVQEEENIVALTAAQVQNTGVTTVKPQKKTMSPVLKVNGKIDVPPQNMVSISVPLGGYLKSSHLLPGTKVQRGETIAIIEDPGYIELQKDYLTTQIDLSYLEKEYQRQKELNQTKAISDKVFQQSESAYLSQKIKLKSLGEKLSLIGINPLKLDETNISKSIQITSPIDGYVSVVNVNVGKYVTPTDVLFELVNPKDIHLNLTVYEKDIDKLYINQKVTAYTNHTDKKYACEIILIGQNVTSERNVEVHCHFLNYDKSLVPGMFMNADILLDSKEVLALPVESVVTYGNKKYIFEAKSNNKFELIEVKVGYSDGDFIEVMDCPRNADIVSKGAYTLLSALKNKGD